MKKIFNLKLMILGLLFSFTFLGQSVAFAVETNSHDPNELRNNESRNTQACNTTSGFCERKNSAAPDRHAPTAASSANRPNNPVPNDSAQ